LGLRWRGGMRKLVAVIQAVWPGVESPGNQTSGDMVMKKWMLVLAVGALVPVSSWAAMQAAAIAGRTAGNELSLAAQFSLGLVNGEAREHVYDYDGPGGGRRQLSRLDWDLKGVAMGGGSVSVRMLKKLTLNGGVWLALSEGSGEMEDYDWMLVNSGDWTHYSLSDVNLTEGYLLDVNVAWDLLDNWNNMTARVMAGYKQNGWTWEDEGIFLLYPEYGYVPQDLGGENMINYEQEFRIPYLGVSADWTSGGWTLSGYAIYSPFVSATDWDEHVARDAHFEETFDGGDMFGLGLEVRYDIQQGFFKNAFVSAAVDYQMIDLIVGDMTMRDGSTGAIGSEKDVAGIENKFLVMSLGGGIRF